jgi:ribonuclease HI
MKTNVEEKTTWKMYFNGASNQQGYEVGVLLIAPDGVHIPLSAKLNFVATNNIAEYEACIVGLEALLAIDVKEVEIYGDSALVLAQA